MTKEFLDTTGRGISAAIPIELPKWIADNLDAMLRAGVDISKLNVWDISFLEVKGDHGAGFSNALRHLESMMMRGWLVPERVATEGQQGTKAESATQTETATTISDVLFDDIIRSVNWYIINPLLVYNFGQQYENKVWIKKGGLTEQQQAFYRAVMTQVLSQPINIGFFKQWTDIDAILETLGWPRPEQQPGQEPGQGNLPADQNPANPDLAKRVATMMASMNRNKENKPKDPWYKIW
jgi:hypothetical protein